MWDISTGKQLGMIDTKSAVRTCNFSYSGNMVCFTTDKQMGHQCEINVVDARNFSMDEPVLKMSIPPNGPKVKIEILTLNRLDISSTDILCSGDRHAVERSGRRSVDRPRQR